MDGLEEDAPMLHSLRAVVTVGCLVSALAACSGGPSRPAARPAGANDSGVTTVPPPPLRGTLTRDGDAFLVRECGAPADRALRIVDATGEVAKAFASLGAKPAGVYAELRGTPAPAGGSFAVSEVVRAAAAGEGPSCERPVLDGDYVVSGNEPPWGIEIRADGIVYRSPEEPRGRTYPYAFTRTETGGVLYATKRDKPSVSTLEIALTAARCIDSMSGEWRSFKARVVLDGKTLEGCAAAGVPSGGFGGGPLDELNRFAGVHPETVRLWETEPLARRLDTLLGAKKKTFLENIQVKGPLMKEDEVFYVTGNRRHDGGSDTAVFLADPATDTINVILFVKAAREDFKEGGREVAIPAEVAKSLDALSRP